MRISKRALLQKSRETVDLYNSLDSLKLIAFRFFSKGKISPEVKKLMIDLKVIVDKLLSELQK